MALDGGSESACVLAGSGCPGAVACVHVLQGVSVFGCACLHVSSLG